MIEPSFNVPVLVEWLNNSPARQTVSGSRDLRGTSQFIHNPSAFNIENLDTRLSLGFLNEKFKQVYVAVQSAFKRSKTVEGIQREMSLRCENGAKLLMRRHHALRRVTPRGVESQYSSSNVGMQHEKISGPLSENQNGTEVLARRWHCHIVHFAASRRTASKRNINIQNVGVQDQNQRQMSYIHISGEFWVSGLPEGRERCRDTGHDLGMRRHRCAQLGGIPLTALRVQWIRLVMAARYCCVSYRQRRVEFDTPRPTDATAAYRRVTRRYRRVQK
ncbi:hypothetical protein C8F04DRAFT_1194423 [Mycena alexandri]|uniref:Uncharacterized protein n=1 Tax=Mycena alexandri TaxID=1745969 RepID=A0AAD6S7D6_9AGAR|nr:hypothetical protein C8F04DRAFT_1194423 [Mycena alexandri]